MPVEKLPDPVKAVVDKTKDDKQTLTKDDVELLEDYAADSKNEAQLRLDVAKAVREYLGRTKLTLETLKTSTASKALVGLEGRLERLEEIEKARGSIDKVDISKSLKMLKESDASLSLGQVNDVIEHLKGLKKDYFAENDDNKKEFKELFTGTQNLRKALEKEIKEGGDPRKKEKEAALLAYVIQIEEKLKADRPKGMLDNLGAEIGQTVTTDIPKFTGNVVEGVRSDVKNFSSGGGTNLLMKAAGAFGLVYGAQWLVRQAWGKRDAEGKGASGFRRFMVGIVTALGIPYLAYLLVKRGAKETPEQVAARLEAASKQKEVAKAIKEDDGKSFADFDNPRLQNGDDGKPVELVGFPLPIDVNGTKFSSERAKNPVSGNDEVLFGVGEGADKRKYRVKAKVLGQDANASELLNGVRRHKDYVEFATAITTARMKPEDVKKFVTELNTRGVVLDKGKTTFVDQFDLEFPTVSVKGIDGKFKDGKYKLTFELVKDK